MEINKTNESPFKEGCDCCELPEGGLKGFFRTRKQGVLNTCYLLGTLCISLSSINQIVKTYQTQSAEDFAMTWLLMLIVGHVFHLPRSLSSGYWVWKLNCILGMILIMVLLGGIIAYS